MNPLGDDVEWERTEMKEAAADEREEVGLDDVPPGIFSDDFIEGIEKTLSAAIREAVMASELLQAGELSSCMDALFQVRVNALQVEERIKDRLKEVQS